MKAALEVGQIANSPTWRMTKDHAALVRGDEGGTAMNCLDWSIMKTIFAKKTLTSTEIYEALSVKSLSPNGILELFQRIQSLKNQGLIVEDSAYGRTRYELTEAGRMRISDYVGSGENLGVQQASL